jgi:lipopolysaccharide export system protein LptA
MTAERAAGLTPAASLLGLACLALVIAAPSPAAGQIANSDDPIEVTARRTDYFRDEGRVVYTEDVRAVQGETEITADKLTVVCVRNPPQRGEPADPSCNEIEKIIADGDVLFSTPREKIRGTQAEYDYTRDVITITGDVILSNGEGVARGARLIYSVNDGRATITAGDRGQVTSIFTPRSRSDRNATGRQP